MKLFNPPDISTQTYKWSVRAFSTVKRLLGINIKLHGDARLIDDGHIFLFNHFSRFETFIPQYLIYQYNQSYCRSIAASQFFRGDERFSNYLYRVGAVPNDMPGLLAFLARDILRGKKIIIFPEGGMVKDRRIMDEHGEFAVYSSTAKIFRKHHTGAARLALLLDLYKKSVLEAHNKNDIATLSKWQNDLGIENLENLIKRCQEPTRIIPGNITFYPIRISENVLKKTFDQIAGDLPKRYSEELLIETNLLLKDTDMDIRLGPAIETHDIWSWFDRKLMSHVASRLNGLDDFFALGNEAQSMVQRIASKSLYTNTERLRDRYMEEIYKLVTLNLSHMASGLILRLIEHDIRQISIKSFLWMLYLAAKSIRAKTGIHLHRSLLDPLTYRDLRDGFSKEFKQFCRSSEEANLIAINDRTLFFLEKLRAESDFDTIRLENLILVYANECAAIPVVKEEIDRAMSDHITLQPTEWAQHFYEDEMNAFKQAQKLFSSEIYQDVNASETRSTNGAPIYLLPKGSRTRKTAVLLVHGFLASPYEMQGLASKLQQEGYCVFAPRLEGHGTSPADLRTKSWQEWMRSVTRGFDLLETMYDHITIVGFSTGGALSLLFGAERPQALSGICAISTPLRFANPNLKFIPLIHHANRLAKWLAAQEGVLPYINNVSEHPDINYHKIPVRALHELRQLVFEMERNLSRINCPTTLIQGDQEKVVNPQSAALIRDQMVATTPKVIMVPSTRHGILQEDIGGTQQLIMDFIHEQEERF